VCAPKACAVRMVFLLAWTSERTPCSRHTLSQSLALRRQCVPMGPPLARTQVIDEIGNEAEALAARSISQRGIQLIATAHGAAPPGAAPCRACMAAGAHPWGVPGSARLRCTLSGEKEPKIRNVKIQKC